MLKSIKYRVSVSAITVSGIDDTQNKVSVSAIMVSSLVADIFEQIYYNSLSSKNSGGAII